MTVKLLTLLFLLAPQATLSINVIKSKEKSEIGRAKIKDVELQVIGRKTFLLICYFWYFSLRPTRSWASAWDSRPLASPWRSPTSPRCTPACSPSPAWSPSSTGAPRTARRPTLAALRPGERRPGRGGAEGRSSARSYSPPGRRMARGFSSTPGILENGTLTASMLMLRPRYSKLSSTTRKYLKASAMRVNIWRRRPHCFSWTASTTTLLSTVPSQTFTSGTEISVWKATEMTLIKVLSSIRFSI